jgi:catechol 2,3-dioxygenase-like lactoylglutathione lyase family enzyme
MATRIQVTIDCADPNRLARFWAEALGYRLEEPPAGFDTWQAYWASRGLPEEELEDGYDSIVDPDGIGPRDLVPAGARRQGGQEPGPPRPRLTGSAGSLR